MGTDVRKSIKKVISRGGRMEDDLKINKMVLASLSTFNAYSILIQCMSLFNPYSMHVTMNIHYLLTKFVDASVYSLVTILQGQLG